MLELYRLTMILIYLCDTNAFSLTFFLIFSHSLSVIGTIGHLTLKLPISNRLALIFQSSPLSNRNRHGLVCILALRLRVDPLFHGRTIISRLKNHRIFSPLDHLEFEFVTNKLEFEKKIFLEQKI